MSLTNTEQRKFAAIDGENLYGGTGFNTSDVADLVAEVRTVAGASATTHITIATSFAVGCLTAGLGCPSARCTYGVGPDGADLALIDILDTEQIARRFNRVIIGSGDHAFAPVARRLRAEGATVVVVARRHSLNAELGDVASSVVYLPESDQPGTTTEAA